MADLPNIFSNMGITKAQDIDRALIDTVLAMYNDGDLD